MKLLWMLPVLGVTFAAGWWTGRAGTGEPAAAAATVCEVPPAPLRAKSGRIPNETAVSQSRGLREAERWRDKWEEIPEGDRAAAMRAWMESFGFGGASSSESFRLTEAIGNWAKEDFDAAWQWAQGLADPVAREFGVIAIATTIGRDDPMKGVECLESLGEFLREVDFGQLNYILAPAMQQAIAAGPEAVRDLWSRIPLCADSVTTTSGSVADWSGVQDLASFAAVMAEVREQGRRPLFIDGLMDEWARRDLDGAADHLVERAAHGNIREDLSTLRRHVSGSGGEEEGSRWLAETLQRIPPEDREAMIGQYGYQNFEHTILRLAPELFSAGERNSYLADVLNARLDHEDGVDALLDGLEETDRADVISRLGTVEKPGGLLGYLRRKGASEEEITRLAGRLAAP